MNKFTGWLAGLGGILIALLSAFFMGKNSEQKKQAQETLKRFKKGKEIKRKVENETKDMDASDITNRIKSLK